MNGNGGRSFAGLMFLAVLSASASPEQAGSGNASLVQVARVEAAHQSNLGRLAPLVKGLPLASRPVDEARRNAKPFEDFSGGSTGALLVGAALFAAMAVIVAVAISW